MNDKYTPPVLVASLRSRLPAHFQPPWESDLLLLDFFCRSQARACWRAPSEQSALNCQAIQSVTSLDVCVEFGVVSNPTRNRQARSHHARTSVVDLDTDEEKVPANRPFCDGGLVKSM
jgi:hypothetical protein